MALKKTKKRRKSSRMHGRKQGTHGWGSRKKHKKSGHRGGKGRAGTGKRADQKKSLMTKLYGHNYFGKQGITSKKTERDKRKRINLKDIELNIEKYGKKTGNSWHLDLPDYKILDAEEDYNVKNKMIIKGMAASASASEKVKKAGGEIVVSKKVNENKKKADED